MKATLLTLALFIGLIGFSQDNNIKVQKQGSLYHVTVFHTNGEIAQVGYITENKKLHGIWTSFDTKGKKVTRGLYENGKKSGRWFFWKKDSQALTQVDFGKDYRVASVLEKTTNSQLAENDSEE